VRTIFVSFVFFAAWPEASSAAAKVVDSLAQEQREVDDLLTRADSVELRKIAPQVFRLAARLLKEKGDAEAQPYFEKGLQGNPWALEEQLTLGEILGRKSQPAALQEKAEMVLRVGEEPDVLARASRLLGRPVPAAATDFAGLHESEERVLVLAPLADASIFTLLDLQSALAKKLGFKVVVASLAVELPKADRSAKTQWVVRTREKVLQAVKDQPPLAAQLGWMGFPVEQLRTSDDAVVGLIRKSTETEQGAAAVQNLDAMLAQFEQTMQWDVAKVITALQAAVGSRAGPRLMVLGVAPFDLFGGTSNFLFGAGATGGFLGVVSLHRFRAAFNDEPPKRERLNDRLLKQSLSTLGFMIGVPRCTTPECARAYPQSLAEHDQKPSKLCRQCQVEFERVLGAPLPAE
jgi:predicted Zn-dependent protease